MYPAIKIFIALLPAIPILGFLVLALFGQKMTRKTAGFIGAGSIGMITLLTFIIATVFLKSLPQVRSYTVVVWEWINAGNLRADTRILFCYYFRWFSDTPLFYRIYGKG
jgi:NADH-quinone oxidoreductase subunit L